jgi:MGT family glycosyltransferase
MNRRYRILFLSHPSTGHVNSLVSMALHMQEEGHVVQFLLPGTRLPLKLIKPVTDNIRMFQAATAVPQFLEGYGLSFDIINVPVIVGLRGIMLPYATGYRETRYAFDLMSRGTGYYTRKILDYIKDKDFDVLVSDFALPASHLAAEITGIPCAVVFHCGLPFKGKSVPPFGSGLPFDFHASPLYDKCVQVEKKYLARLDKRINKFRQKLGLKPFQQEYLREPYSRWLNLVVSASALEVPRDNLTDNTFFIGPCFRNRKSHDSEFQFDLLLDNKFIVYVSLGTVFNNKPNVFRTIMAGLESSEYQVIISAGSAYEKLRNEKIPGNVLMFPWVSQLSLLPRVDMVIGHGGNNSTNEALAAGKPLIIVPIGGEQSDNARRVEYLGVGLSITLDALTPELVADKAGQIRSDKRFQARAIELKYEIDKTDGTESASKLIQLLVRTGKPLKRPSSIPLTVRKDDYVLLDTLTATCRTENLSVHRQYNSNLPT